MRKTYSWNGILIGGLLAVLIYLKTGNMVLTVAAGIVLAVACFLAIRGVEKLIDKGVDAAANAAKQGLQKHYEKKYENEKKD